MSFILMVNLSIHLPVLYPATTIFQCLFLYKIYILMSLTQEKADNRSQWIRQNTIEYDFHLVLNQGSEFHGLAQISFYLDSTDFESLPLDFSCKKVHALQVNQIKIEPDLSQDRFLLITNKEYNGHHLLRRGKNRITVLYSGDYDTSGEGCVTYTETAESGKKSQYLYTQFEAYCANMVFPCFDQPDLKAPMKLSITAPSIWKILSNEYPQGSVEFSKEQYLKQTKIHGHSKHLLPNLFEFVPKECQGTYLSTVFPATKLLPTYLYCFIAGDYEEIKCTLPHDLPFQLSIYSISSYKPYLQNLSNFIFDVTIQSIKFYEDFFGYPYSFPKFDQVWVHEFRAGAMENAGIVTYNDADLYKEKNPTSVQLVELADTITHELSHHWFGNLVTMKWWDDLWLNQSFADFISYFCIEKIKDKLQYKVDSALSIFRDREIWGYKEDSRNSTTHPIRAAVSNTSETDSIFDGITYSKGGACLQQLMSLMGEQNFSKSLSSYFNRFEWSNASIDDFLEEMSFNFKETEFTLNQWKEMWLMTASLNVIRVQWEAKDNKLTLNINQGFNTEKYSTLRFRRVEVALFNEKAQIFKTISLLIHPKESEILEEAVDQSVCAVLYNHNDQDFSENIIDSKSLLFFEQNLPKIRNLLSRTVLWYNLLSMCERGAYPICKFVALAERYIFGEKMEFLFENILCRLRNTITENLPIEKRAKQFSLIFNRIYSQLTSGKEFSQERVNILKNELISYASSTEEKTVLLNWLEGRQEKLLKIELDIVGKWSVGRKVFTLPNLTVDQKKAIFDSIAKGDQSDSKTEEAHVFDALVASKDRFEQLYLKLTTEDKSVSLTVKKLITAGWRNMVHEEWLSKEYKQKYFADLLPLSETLPYLHYQHFYRMLKPIDDDVQGQIQRYQTVVQKLQQKVDESGEGKIHAKQIKKIIDDLLKKKGNYEVNS